jgi:hypothetical protein
MEWTAKAFEVVAVDFVITEGGNSPEVSVALSLRETAEGVFDWNSGLETTVDLAPNTNLPSPFSIASIVGLSLSSGTADLYKRGDGTIAPRIKASWTALADFFVTSGGFVEVQFKPSSTGDWLDVSRIPGSSSMLYIVDVQDGAYYDVRARTVNSFNAVSDWTTVSSHFVVGKTAPPPNVSGFAATISEYGISFGWSAIADLDLSYYEVREGATWETATSQGKPKNTVLNVGIRAAGSYTFKIKAVDTTGNESTSEATASVTITAPSVVSGSVAFNSSNVVLDWADATGGSWATEDYTVSYGTTFGSSTFVAKTKASQYTTRANWSGLRKFWVVPNDIYGNAGTPFSFDVSLVSPPAVTSLTAKVIDNNVLLKWNGSTGGSLPVEYYQVKVGATFGGATLVGQTAATYSTLFEIVSGDYTYWIVPVDTAGNVGTENYIMATVDQPVDFVLQSNASLVLASASVLTNCLVDFDGTLLLPVDKTKTWTNHFSDNSWSTPQDQIDAGYPIFIQPTLSTATYTQTHDIGTLITGGSLVRVDLSTTNISGSLTLTPTLSVSDDNSTWRDYAGVYSVFESNFRYVKISIAASGGGTALTRINSAQVVVSVKLKRDSGAIAAKASDASGTTVTFGQSFFDIVGTPQVTTTEVIRAAEQWGTGNRLTAGDHADFEPGNGDFTIAGWVKFQSLSTSFALAQKWGTSNQREYILAVSSGSSNQLTFFISSDGVAATQSVICTKLGTPPLNQWIFIACWHDAAGDVIGIRANRLAAETTAAAAGVFAGTRTGDFALGGRSDDSTLSLVGQMKNWGVWKGRVLSSSDLDSLYDAGFQKYSELSAGMKTSMVGFWELNEASGTRDDAHTSAHDLTVTGTVGARLLPLQALSDFTDAANPTTFKAYVFTESQVRVSANASWYADGYTNIG